METGRPADVLPDREADTAREWLKAHPEVEVICRDRAGAYAQAARDGAPQAIQVADRWHIWHNLCEYAGQAVARHRDCLAGSGCARQDRAADQHEDHHQQARAHDEGGPPAGPEAVIRARHAAVHELRAAGKTLDEAAAALGLSRQLAGRFWRAGAADALLKTARASGLDPYKPHLRRRWEEGITSIAALHREITALGYAGGELTTYRWLALLKLAAPAKPPAPPTRQQVTGWLLTDPARLDDDEQAQLSAVLGRCPELRDLAGHVTEFATMLTGRLGDRLGDRLTAGSPPPASTPPSPRSPTASAATTRPSATP